MKIPRTKIDDYNEDEDKSPNRSPCFNSSSQEYVLIIIITHQIRKKLQFHRIHLLQNCNVGKKLYFWTAQQGSHSQGFAKQGFVRQELL